MKKHISGLNLGLAAIASLGLVQSGQAQSADALLDKLVQKGVLTQQEAEELKEQADADFTRSYQVRSGLPDWVTTLKVTGDLRGRFEGFYADPENADGNDIFKDRPRLRYRARIGLVATLLDNFEAGVRLSSSEPTDSFGGDPISGNTTFQNNGSYKFVFIDRAYGKWNPTFGAVGSSTTIGKMENPFLVSDMIFDNDYSPEGVAQQFRFPASDVHMLNLNLGGFVLDEIGGDSDDPFLLGAQVRWTAKFNPVFDATVGVGAFLIDNEEALSPAITPLTVPNINRGNTADPQFNPIVADIGFGYTMESFPRYSGAFPIRVVGEYLYNPAMEERNQGFMAGLSFGRAGRRGTWELSYRYKYIEADAWFDEFPDSDFGALRPTVSPTTGALTSVSYNAGTNLKGHVLRASYSPSDAFTFGVTYFLTSLITSGPVPEEDDLATGRLQVDALWRF